MHVIMHHCILHNILHDGREGGPGLTCRRTHWQPWNLVNTFGDAYLSKQGVYCICTDSSSEFEIFNRAKLLRLMYDQGIPTDAIEVVKGIYKDSRTAVARPFGTNPLLIPVTRGTIQGDPRFPPRLIAANHPHDALATSWGERLPISMPGHRR